MRWPPREDHRRRWRHHRLRDGLRAGQGRLRGDAVRARHARRGGLRRRRWTPGAARGAHRFGVRASGAGELATLPGGGRRAARAHRHRRRVRHARHDLSTSRRRGRAAGGGARGRAPVERVRYRGLGHGGGARARARAGHARARRDVRRRGSLGQQPAAGRRLAQAAVAAGVVLRSGTSVSRIIVEDGRTHGVVADGDRWEADAVLLAAGAWTAALAASFGARLRVEPARGQMVALLHVPPLLNHVVHSDDVYLVPRPSGELLIGATVERVGFQRSVTAEGIASLLAAAIGLVPSLGALPIAHTWYGFRPWAPDRLPILGPWPDASA